MGKVPDKQPEQIDIQIPIMNGAIMYSMMDAFSLRRLRKFLDDLIAWKEAGNACHICTYMAVIEYEPQQEQEE